MPFNELNYAELEGIPKPEVIIRASRPGAPDRTVLVQLSAEERKYLAYEAPRKGSLWLQVELGLRRMAKLALHGLGWTLLGVAAALAKGSAVPDALIIGAASAAGGSIVSVGVQKTVDEKQKKSGGTKWQAALELLVEFLSLLITAWQKKREGAK